mmetsp:Transcript_2974/g.7195  ORF Transcript_2974/g.7195 Transcript_2974/m.7195 type:complete len:451 (+) Transcript_2974:1409-2761(+)
MIFFSKRKKREKETTADSMHFAPIRSEERQLNSRELALRSGDGSVGRFVARSRCSVAGGVGRAAGLLVVAANRLCVRAAAVHEAGLLQLEHAAAGRVGLALLHLVALHLWRRGRARARWRGWAWWGVHRLLDRVAGHLGDAADACRRHAHGHLHVPFVAPQWAPGVLHQPVVLVVLARAHAGHQHAVVQLCAALWVVEDPAGVQLEVLVVGLDGHGDRVLANRLDHGVLVARGNVLKSVDAHHQAVLPGRVTLALHPAVRVVLLGVEAVVLHELEGVVHDAALAAVVHRRVAVDQLLLAQRDQLAREHRVRAFHRARRREGPAAAAVALVLHRRDDALLAPVLRVRVLVAAQRTHVLGFASRRAVRLGLEEPRLLELLPAHIRELVHLEEECGVRVGIARLDDIQIFREDSETLLQLRRVVRVIPRAVLGDECLVLLHHVGLVVIEMMSG